MILGKKNTDHNKVVKGKMAGLYSERDSLPMGTHILSGVLSLVIQANSGRNTMTQDPYALTLMAQIRT